jgi:hypothetical protein
MHDGAYAFAAAERQALAELVRELGEKYVCEKLGTSRFALARILAELPVRAGTAALVRIGLKELKARSGSESTTA